VVLVALLGAVSALVPEVASAQEDDPEDVGRLAAVQHRKFREAHELQVAAMTLPLDAFYKGVGLEIGYTWHFSDRWAWEVIHAGYSYDVDTGLKQQLETEFGVQPTAFDLAQYYANSDIVFKPLYLKASFFNRAVVHGEAFLMAGGGIFRFQTANASGSLGIYPAVNAGAGGRVYLSPHISVRLDGRENVVFLTGIKQVPVFSLGVSFDFGGD
jgi:outer membrane beta-barrel protein